MFPVLFHPLTSIFVILVLFVVLERQIVVVIVIFCYGYDVDVPSTVNKCCGSMVIKLLNDCELENSYTGLETKSVIVIFIVIACIF